MGTLLVTRRMSPELAARVLASVRGQQGGAGRQRLLKALLRFLTVAALISAVGLFFYLRSKNATELSRARSALLSSMLEHSSKLSRTDTELGGRVETAVALHSSATYPGDQISDDLRSEAQLVAALSEPTLYLRGSLDGLSRPARVSELAASSFKDAFVLCLLAPPEARSEKALRAKASAAHAQGPSMQVATHIERVEPLLRALPFLGPAFKARVVAAETSAAVATLRRYFEAAPVQAAVRAAKARQLLLVIDEPSTTKAPTELDGERPHAVRVVLTDLRTGELRLRLRKDVDPGWLSDNARAQFASGIDSCSLALDVRAALGAP
ncbi:MAG TPA: hypothetical protein VHP33_27330 [Polyangiaceae bacterium]|nr:hypothetical protein [Polyangiaceae bacterium]